MLDNWAEDTRFLLKMLRTPAFRFIVVNYNHGNIIRDLEKIIRQKFPERPFLKIDITKTNYGDISKSYRELGSGFFWLENFHDALQDETDSQGREMAGMADRNQNRREIVAGLNLRRDLWAQSPIAMFILVSTPQMGLPPIRTIMEKMPDLWSLRALVLDMQLAFKPPIDALQLTSQMPEFDFSSSLGGDTLEEKQRELDRLNALLNATPVTEIQFRNTLLVQIAELNKYIQQIWFGMVEGNVAASSSILRSNERRIGDIYTQYADKLYNIGQVAEKQYIFEDKKIPSLTPFGETPLSFFSTLRDQIARDELDAALAQLRELLAHSPLLDEAIHHEGRFENIRKQIRLGTVSHQEATLTQNQIRAALLELITAIEQQAANPSVGAASSHPDTTALHTEIAQAISIVQSKNVVKDSLISSGRDTHIGDKTEIHHHYGDKKIPRHLTAPPFNTEPFLGRENDLNAIEADYQQNNRLLVLVNGEGGIGKTTLAAKYWYTHEARYRHLAWLYSDAGIGAALVTLKEKLGVAFDPEDTLETQVQRMAEALSNLQAPCLLVFDNANNEADLKQHYALLNRLSNCHILLTSRVRKVANMKTHAVEPLAPEAAVELFGTHYPDLTKAELPLLRDVLQAVGHNTLVTEVLAKNLAAFNRFSVRYTLADLLRDLQAKGLLALKNKTVAVVYGSDTLREAQPTDIIAAMYDLAQLGDAERLLLSNLSALPAENIPYPLLLALLGTQEDVLEAPLGTLETKGWIEYRKSDNTFKISPVVQEITKIKNAERLLEDCRTLVNTLSQRLNNSNRHTDNYQPAAVFARLGAVVVQVLPVDDDVATLCQNIGMYYQDIGDLRSMERYYQKMLYIQKTLYASEPDNAHFKNGLAISYSKLGEMYKTLGDLPQALTFFEQFNALEKELCASYPRNEVFKNDLAISYSKLGSTQMALGNLPEALNFFEERNRLGKELYDSYPENVVFKNGVATSYSKLGSTHMALGNLQQALAFFEKSTEVMKELYDSYPQNVDFKNNLAVSYEKLGSTQMFFGNSAQALALFEKSAELMELLNNSYPQNVGFKNGLAVSYIKLGETYKALGNLTQALVFFEKSRDLMKALSDSYPQDVSFKNGLAASYSKLGEIHKSIGNLSQALSFFEESTELIQVLYDSYPQNVEFKNNLAVSYEKLGSTHTELHNLTQALIFFEKRNRLSKELYDAYPQNINFKNNLAISFEKLGLTHLALGKLPAALTYFEELNRLSKELHASEPQNVDFKNGLAISYEKLGEAHMGLGNLSQALIFFEEHNRRSKELHDLYPQNVEFKNNLAVSYYKLGKTSNATKDKAKAKDYFQQAEAIWKELVRDAPRYAQFQAFLDTVKKDLSGLDNDPTADL